MRGFFVIASFEAPKAAAFARVKRTVPFSSFSFVTARRVNGRA